MRARSRFRYVNPWDVVFALRALAIVSVCAMIGHRWALWAQAGGVLECRRCKKVDWHPDCVPAANQHSTLPILWDAKHWNARGSLPRPHANLITEFGVPEEVQP